MAAVSTSAVIGVVAATGMPAKAAQSDDGVSYRTATVQVLENNTANCAGTSQYFSAVDENGVPVNWTYANGSHQCVDVRWQLEQRAQTCSILFYVPKGYATGRLNFEVWRMGDDRTPLALHPSIDEASVDGWVRLISAPQLMSMRFGDNNGQSYPAQIGWGQGEHSVIEVC